MARSFPPFAIQVTGEKRDRDLALFDKPLNVIRHPHSLILPPY